MNTWLPVTGRLEIENGNIRIKLPNDFVGYYKQFVDKEYKIFSNFPMHNSHVTIVNSKLHTKVFDESFDEVWRLYGKIPLTLEYDPFIKMGGFTKNFRNWYVIVRGEILDDIARICNIPPPNLGWHSTICSTKNGVRPYIWMK